MLTKRNILAFLIVALVVIGVAAPLNNKIVTAQDGGKTGTFTDSGGGHVADPGPLAAECVGGYQHDDGSIENGYRYNPGFGIFDDAYFAIQYDFGPASMIVTQVCVCQITLLDTQNDSFDVVFFDDNAGQPGNEIGRFSFVLAGIPSALPGAWYDLSVNQLVTGPTWIAANWDVDADQYIHICADNTGPGSPVGDRMSPDAGATWDIVSVEFPGHSALGIRAEAQAVGEDLVAYGICSGDDLEININGGDLPMDIYVGGAYVGTADALGKWYVTGPGAFNDVTLEETTGDLEVVNIGSFNCPSFGVPNLGLVQIANWQGIQPYGMPGMDQLSFVLPNDADGNGFDTYIVADVELYGDEYWLGLFIGGPDWVWVPYSAVTPLTEIAGID